jgi:hypothetical protein
MTIESLTFLQRGMIARLQLVGLEDPAYRARSAWRDGRRYRTESAIEKATMEGAKICADFRRANEHVAASA